MISSYKLLLLALGFWLRTGAERATVHLPFDVNPTDRGKFTVVNLNSSAARGAFPRRDILVTSLRFKRVQIEGDDVFSHMRYTMLRQPFARPTHPATGEALAMLVSNDHAFPDPNRQPPPGNYGYHHMAIHQGTGGEFDHEHAAISYGTIAKSTSFAPYGLRLRPDTPIFACLHARYVSSSALKLTYRC